MIHVIAINIQMKYARKIQMHSQDKKVTVSQISLYMKIILAPQMVVKAVIVLIILIMEVVITVLTTELTIMEMAA